MSMHSRSFLCGTQKPLSALGWEQRGAAQSRLDGHRIFQPRLSKRTTSQRRLLRARADSSLRQMAQSVLSKPHRFILVSDLDWTMVRV